MQLSVNPRLWIAAAGMVWASHAPALDDSFALSAGYRTDSLRWNIASDLTGVATPNVLSELDWRSVRIAQLALGWKGNAASGMHYRVNAAYGWIYSGDNRDSDYLSDNRTGEFSRSENDTPGDDVADFSAALGYPLPRQSSDSFLITPLLGLSYHRQNLRIANGNQVIPPTGPFTQLDSTYQARWSGPWAGIEFAETTPELNGYLRLEYHWADFDSEANWNLRSDFQHPRSFEQTANGRGPVIALGFLTPPGDDGWSLRFAVDWLVLRATGGVDRVFFSDGDVAATRLNEVKWHSTAVSFGVEKNF